VRTFAHILESRSNMAKKIPSFQDLYGGDYLNPVDLNGKKIRVTFTKAEVLELRCQNQKNDKIVLSAALESGQACRKKIAVKKTSAKALAVAWGIPNTEKGCPEWLGKLAELSHAKVQAFGAMKDCILISPLEGAVKPQIIHDDDDLGPAPDEPGHA